MSGCFVLYARQRRSRHRAAALTEFTVALAVRVASLAKAEAGSTDTWEVVMASGSPDLVNELRRTILSEERLPGIIACKERARFGGEAPTTSMWMAPPLKSGPFQGS